MLTRIAKKTEANFYFAPQPRDLIKIYQRISLLLHSQLLIKYKTPCPMDDTWHDLKITIPYLGKEIFGERAFRAAKETRTPAEHLAKIRDEEMKKQKQKERNRQKQEMERVRQKKKTEKNLITILLVAVLLLVFILFVVILLRKKK